MRSKHPRKEGEEALTEIEATGWSVTRRRRYFLAKMFLREGYLTHFHRSPSNPNYFQEKVRYCRRGLRIMKVRVGVAFDVLESGASPDQDQLAAHLGDVLDALMDMQGVLDPDVSATLSEGHVEIRLVLEVEDELTAAKEGTAAVRTAVNAAGGYESWGVVGENMHVLIEKVDELSPA